MSKPTKLIKNTDIWFIEVVYDKTYCPNYTLTSLVSSEITHLAPGLWVMGSCHPLWSIAHPSGPGARHTDSHYSWISALWSFIWPLDARSTHSAFTTTDFIWSGAGLNLHNIFKHIHLLAIFSPSIQGVSLFHPHQYHTVISNVHPICPLFWGSTYKFLGFCTEKYTQSSFLSHSKHPCL